MASLIESDLHAKEGSILSRHGYEDLFLVTAVDSSSSWPIKAINLRSGNKDSYTISDFRNLVTMQLDGVNHTGKVQLTTKTSGIFSIVKDSTTDTDIKFTFETQTGIKKAIGLALKRHYDANTAIALLEAKGESMVATTFILEDVAVDIPLASGDIREQYTAIVGSMSDLTRQINETFSLDDTKEIAATFLSAKKKITALAGTSPGKVTTFMSKYASKIPGGTALISSVSTTLSENSSVQKNINFLFGVINDKYEKLITVGENLQSAKGHMVAQIKALETLAITSAEEVATYGAQTDVPIRVLMLDTQINASIAKYKARLIKVDGSITACQTTILALGKDLPSLRTDLTDEMAIGGLLNSVDDYQKMYTEIASLVANVTEATAEKTHHVIENLLQMQIDDTHTLEYLAAASARTEKFGAMVADKSAKLYNKVYRDAQFIAEITAGNSIEHARSSVKKLSN